MSCTYTMVAHNCHGKTKNLTAKTKTSRQNQILHSKNKKNSFGFAVGICFCREVFGFCCEVFAFAVRSLVLPICLEGVGFAVRFLVL